MSRKLLCEMFLLFCAATLLGQNTPPAGTVPNSNPSTNNPPSQMRPGRHAGDNCFQQAGLDESVREQIHSISRDARSQIETVCSNTSLTAQQKHEKAREIREQAMQKREALLTPEQQKALAACQQERGGNHSGMHEGNGGGMHEGMGGGCGEMPGPHSGNRAPGNGGSNPAPANPPANN